MSTVFISYRQTDAPQRERVRAFAERLRGCGVDVVLDQFLLDAQPGGPNEGWDKWSSDRALQSEYVLIIGTQDWFQCFDKTQPRGTGLGAACEADDLRDRIYSAGGINASIRVALFDEDQAQHIPGKLRRYHRFHAEGDFGSIARWLGGRVPGTAAVTASTPHTTTPHNLPALQPFFGRKDELERIAEALDPESRTWGALIDAPGGMGKTSLAVRAAYDASPEDFERIVFVSLKSRELDDEGLRDLNSFLISGLAELLNEVARELKRSDITKCPDDKRPRLLLDALDGTRTLLVLDNLESLTKPERDTIFTFVKRLPQGCKAILTSRVRIGSGAEELILEKLSEAAALETVAKLAESNPALARTTQAQRLDLYAATGGSPLLLRWTAGQVGRGSCLTLADALDYLRSCPQGNNSLEFVFGDLVDSFSHEETRVLCALTYFTLPAKIEHVAALTDLAADKTRPVLGSLVNRSLVVPTEELKTFTLVPLVADFLRKKQPQVVAETGDRLEQSTYALVVENGYEHFDRYPVLDAAWPTIGAAIRRFVEGPNDRLQTLCSALDSFMSFTGRWDEHLALSRDAERRAVASGDFGNAGWRAFQAGYIYSLRKEARPMFACADRAEAHWQKAGGGVSERAVALRLRGLGHMFAADHAAAARVLGEAADLWRSVGRDSTNYAGSLNDLAVVAKAAGDFEASERYLREGLEIARHAELREQITTFVGNLADLALIRKDWPATEALAREALGLAEDLGRLELIGYDCWRLAEGLLRQGKKTEALPHARRAVNLLSKLDVDDLPQIRATLAECEA